MNTLKMIGTLIPLICFTTITATQVLATSIRQFSIDELLDKSELVFEGRVLGSRQVTRGEMIYTYVQFEIIDLIKGGYPGSELELRFLGGTNDKFSLSVAESVIPAPNESGVYFIESTAANLVNPILGWSQGHFLVEYDGNGTARVTTNQHDPVTAVSEPTARSAAAARNPGGPSARGITVYKTLPLGSGMLLKDFKNDLLDRMAGGQP